MNRKFTLLFLILLAVGLANALTIPHAFYGSVSDDGGTAPNGAVVTAKLNGVEVDTCSVKDGKYGYGSNNTLIVEDEKNNGGTITFYVNGIKANEEYTFKTSEITKLDLTVSGTIPSSCQESWTCNIWSECLVDRQTRTCTDKNDCGTSKTKPTERRLCYPDDDSDTTTSSGGGSSGGGSGGGSSGGSSGSGSSGSGGGSTSSSSSTSTYSGTSSGSNEGSSVVNTNTQDNTNKLSGSKTSEESSGNSITGAVTGLFKDKPVPAYSGLTLLLLLLASGVYFWVFK